MAELKVEFAAFVKEGQLLGYEGDALASYVRERQKEEREERAARREAEKRECEVKEKQKEREEQAKQREEQEKQRQEKAKERQHELEMAKIAAQNRGQVVAAPTAQPTVPYMQFEMPKYKEGENMEAYVLMFERAVQGFNLSEEMKAQRFCAMFAGKPRELISRMDSDATYEVIKKQLLQAYGRTLQEAKENFFKCTAEEKETAEQFMNRVTRCFDEWLTKEEVEEDYNQLYDLIRRNQFERSLNKDVIARLREKRVKEIKEVTHVAQSYAEAHGQFTKTPNQVSVKSGKKPQAQVGANRQFQGSQQFSTQNKGFSASNSYAKPQQQYQKNNQQSSGQYGRAWNPQQRQSQWKNATAIQKQEERPKGNQQVQSQQVRKQNQEEKQVKYHQGASY